MESKTKNKQSKEMIKEMVHKAFGEAKISKEINSIQELKEGFFNASYNILFDNGNEVILKIAPSLKVEVMSYEKGIMNTEVQAMRLVKKLTNVPVPEVYFYDSSKSVCDAEYYFMEKMDGASYLSIRDNIDLKVKDVIERQLGKYNRTMNEIKGEYFGYSGNKKLQGHNWEDTFERMIDSILDDGKRKNVDIGFSYDFIHKIIKNHTNVLKIIKEPKLIHWDLWEGNVFIKHNNVSGIIDFERSLWGDPLMELSFQGILEGLTSKAYLEGYGKTDFSDNEKDRRILYNIYLYLIMTIECEYREYEDDNQYKWAKSRIKAMVDMIKNK